MTYRKPSPPKFVGIVYSALTYTESAVSPQTGRPRVLFEENAALGQVYSREIIDQILKSNELREQLKICSELKSIDVEQQTFYPRE